MKLFAQILLMLSVVITLSAWVGYAAYAHVFVTDETNTKGAVLHIVPDDDPIAGQPATLYFDGQDGIITDDSEIRLTVQAQGGVADTIGMKKNKTTATADYTFPVQGVYKVSVIVKNSDQTYVFHHSQRVSRGVAGESLSAAHTEWAKVLLIAGLVGLCVLGIVAYNRRKAIARQSTF